MNVIEFENVSKRFTLHREKRNSFQERVVNLFRPRGAGETFWGLKDVSFAVPPGETLGLIGHNGSGKSTSLKLITRILEPTLGRVTVRGRVSALLELGSGFHPDLTGRDNIYLNGSLLGFSRADMSKKLEEIVDFAELGPFIDTPVKHYSSGMYMRLGFAVATSVDPDILITDEVLAVGDENFQRKCYDRIFQFRKQGRTIVFVSHALEAVRNLCTQVVWLHHGEVQAIGAANEVINKYLGSVNLAEHERLEHARLEQERVRLEQERVRAEQEQITLEQEQVGVAQPPVEVAPAPIDFDPQRWGSREVEITRVEFLGADEQPLALAYTNQPFTIRMHYLARQPLANPMFGLAIYHASGFHLNGPNNIFANYPIPEIEGTGYVDYTIPALPLLSGTYLVTVALLDPTGSHNYDFHNQKYSFHVAAEHVSERYGTVFMPSRWHWSGERGNGRAGERESGGTGERGNRGTGDGEDGGGGDEEQVLEEMVGVKRSA